MKEKFAWKIIWSLWMVLAIIMCYIAVASSIPQDQKKQPVKTEQVKRDTTISKRQIELEQRILIKQNEVHKMKLDSIKKRVEAKKSGGGENIL